jgi:hypothetical protein
MSRPPRAYITYFDQRYLSRAVVMMRSLRHHDPEHEIFALCFDEVAEAVTAALGDEKIVVISGRSLQAFDSGLAACRDRTRWAFYATHKPILPMYVLERRPDLIAVTHVDADVWFFSSPATLFGMIGEASIALSPHRFAMGRERAAQVGLFNAGFIHWRHDALGLRCLSDYRADCLRWCEDRIEPDGRYMNQGYLTTWPDRYPGVHVIRHPGVNLAPWNIAAHSLDSAGELHVDGVPLVFYHYSNVILDPAGIWRTNYREFGANLDFARWAIYRPYLKAIERAERWIRWRWRGLAPALSTWHAPITTPLRRGPWPRSPRGWLGRARWLFGEATAAERAAI